MLHDITQGSLCLRFRRCARAALSSARWAFCVPLAGFRAPLYLRAGSWSSPRLLGVAGAPAILPSCVGVAPLDGIGRHVALPD